MVPVANQTLAFFSHIAPDFSSTRLAMNKDYIFQHPAFKYEHMIKFQLVGYDRSNEWDSRVVA